MNLRTLGILALCAHLVACTENKPAAPQDGGLDGADTQGTDTQGPDGGAPDAENPDSMPEPVFVAATIRVVDPATGGGASGVTVTSKGVETTTDEMGRATVDVMSGPYEIALTRSDTRTHRVFGVAGNEPFEQITYMSPEMITSFVYTNLGLTDDNERGIVVVGLDLPDLAPAVGASASLDGLSDDSFVFAGNQPIFATEIPANGQGFITFPNVEPGTVEVTVAYPGGACRIFPAESEAVPIEVTAGEVSVVAYTCRL